MNYRYILCTCAKKTTLFLFQIQLGKGGNSACATSQRDRWNDEAVWSKWLCCERCKNRNPKRGFLRKSYNELFRCHFLDSSFVSFFWVETSKKGFMIAKWGHALVSGKKSHLRIKNSWRCFFVAGQESSWTANLSSLHQSLVVFARFCNLNKKGASHRCIQFGVGPETNPRCFQKRCWRAGPPRTCCGGW